MQIAQKNIMDISQVNLIITICVMLIQALCLYILSDLRHRIVRLEDIHFKEIKK